jgi:arylformamidase
MNVQLEWTGKMTIIDVTLDITDPRGTFPGDPVASIIHDRQILKGDQFNTSLITCSSHAGTHIDVPFHLINDGAQLSSITLDKMCGYVYVAEIGSGGPISAETLEESHIDVSASKILIKSYKDPTDFFALDDQYLTQSGADWMITRGITLIGVEPITIESLSNSDFVVHRSLLKNNILIIEGLTLTQVDAGWYMLYCLPLKLGNTDGAPVRAVLISD